MHPRRLICNLDYLADDGIAGWARYEPDRDTPVVLTLLIDGESFVAVPCREPRPDVEAAGFGITSCGFRVMVAPWASTGAPRRLELRDEFGERAELILDGRSVAEIALA